MLVGFSYCLVFSLKTREIFLPLVNAIRELSQKSGGNFVLKCKTMLDCPLHLYYNKR